MDMIEAPADEVAFYAAKKISKDASLTLPLTLSTPPTKVASPSPMLQDKIKDTIADENSRPTFQPPQFQAKIEELMTLKQYAAFCWAQYKKQNEYHPGILQNLDVLQACITAQERYNTLFKQEQERHNALKKQKLQLLARLQSIGNDLKIAITVLDDACRTGNWTPFVDFAKQTATKGLKPAYDTLSVMPLPMERFDVLCIEWPLETLDALVTQWREKETSMPTEVIQEILDFVEGVVRCCLRFNSVLNPAFPSTQPAPVGLFAPMTTTMYQPVTEPQKAMPLNNFVASATTVPVSSEQSISTQLPAPSNASANSNNALIGQIQIDTAAFSKLTKQAIATTDAKNKLRRELCKDMNTIFEAILSHAPDGQSGFLQADQEQVFKRKVNDFLEMCVDRMNPNHSREQWIRKTVSLAKRVQDLWA